MRSEAQRVAAYDAKMQSSTIDPSLTAMNALQMANHAAHVAIFYPKQMILRDLMNGWGISGPVAFQYEAFNAECYAISRRFAGPAAVFQCGTLVVSYTARGLNGVNLREVALDVWSWIVP